MLAAMCVCVCVSARAPAFVQMQRVLEPREGQGRGYVEPARLKERADVFRACVCVRANCWSQSSSIPAFAPCAIAGTSAVNTYTARAAARTQKRYLIICHISIFTCMFHLF